MVDVIMGLSVGRLGLLLLAVFAVCIGSTPDLMARRIDQLTAAYAWSALGWEARHFGDAFDEITAQVFRPADPERAAHDVAAYLSGTLPDNRATPAAVRLLLASAVALELREHGASSVGWVVKPPVTLSLAQPLRLLVVSPRSEIREAYWALLDESFPISGAAPLEEQIEALDVSALVIEQVAIATYPTLIPSGTPPSAALQTVAHEWTHTALFFTPLGQAYGSSPQARAINETTADVVGAEIGDALMRRAGAEPPPRGAVSQSDFSQRLRAIRQHVDGLLAQGGIVEAETYMEEQRRILSADGYRIRRLNQAYFAFFGNYAEGPASSTEVPDAVRALRAESGSLSEFLGRVGRLTSVADLRAAAAGTR